MLVLLSRLVFHPNGPDLSDGVHSACGQILKSAPKITGFMDISLYRFMNTLEL